MALNVDILSVNSLFINGVDILSNKRDYVELVGDEKIVIDVPSATYTKAIPQSGVNLGDVELKTTPLDGKTFDSINNAGGVSVDGVSHIVDDNGCYVSNINIDSFVLNKTSVIKSLDYTTYKLHDVDYGRYDLTLSCDSLSEIGSNGLSSSKLASKVVTSSLNTYSCIVSSTEKKVSNNSIDFNNSTVTTYEGNNISIGTGDFTLETWIKPKTMVDSPLITLGQNGASCCLAIYVVGTGAVLLQYGGGGWGWDQTNRVWSPSIITNNVWQHLVVQRRSGVVDIYVDGVKKYTQNWAYSIPVGNYAHIGSYFATSQYLNSYIDDYRFSTTARYTSDFTVPTTMLGKDDTTKLYLSANRGFIEDLYDLSSVVKKTGNSSIYFNRLKHLASNHSAYKLGANDFTIEFYVCPDINDGLPMTIIQFDNENNYKLTVIILETGMLDVQYNRGSIAGIPTNLHITPNVWTNISVVRSSGVLYIFIDGVKKCSIPFTSVVGGSGDIFIGKEYTSSYNTKSYYYLKGYIDELRVSNNARYTADYTPSTTALLYDGNTVLLMDGDSLNDSTPLSTTVSTDFQTGTASYEFFGTSYITVPSNTKYALGTDDFTIELYTKVKYIDATYGAFIIENRPDGGEVGDYCHYSLRMNTDGRILLQIKSTSGLINMMGNTNQFNKWCHISLVRSSGVIKLYVNGIEESSYNTPLNFTRDTFNIGRGAYGSGFLIGLIDDLRITKGLARYTTNFTPSTTLDTGTRPVRTVQHQGTVIQSELSYSDYLVSYGTAIDPWVAVQPAITVSGEPFTTAVTTITSSSTFTSAETFNIGDIISSDKETFGTVIFEENGEFMVDADIFFDGVTDKPFTPSDANIVNFVKDKRSNLYTNGLRDALLSSVSSTIYGHINDEIIVDAGEGGYFNIGTMYTMGGYQDTDTTSKFNISVSDDGITYTVIYENLENLMNNHAHNMTGTGRFIKITFLNEMGDWGRIITNFVDGKWWDLHIVHPMSKVYRYAARLEVNGKSIVPNYIQWFDNMTINKIVCDKVFINPTTVLNINTENISKVELDLWQEVKGVI